MPDVDASGGRLDAELVRRGLARSRAVATEAIAQGSVTVDGRPALKASLRVAGDAIIAIAGTDHYVSRGAHKLIAALDAFGVDPAGRIALDAGYSDQSHLTTDVRRLTGLTPGALLRERAGKP